MVVSKKGRRHDKTDANKSRNIKPLWQLEKEAILSALKKLNGDKLLAAAKLGIGKTTLYRKLKEHGIRVEQRRRVVGGTFLPNKSTPRLR
jgi:transcriptional regulator of acetoin/glycerol metabolism